MAAGYLVDAVQRLIAAARCLEVTGDMARADELVRTADRVGTLRAATARDADAAHRAEYPGAYDKDGRWIGYRHDGTNNNDREGQG